MSTANKTRSPDAILPDHQALITRSAISPEVAAARGYWSARSRAELRRLGFADYQCRVPALVIPVWNVLGEIAFYQSRPELPRVVRGKPVKYETPAGVGLVLDASPLVRAKLADPNVPLWITEGVRKGDSGVSAGLCCIALPGGVFGFRGTNEFGGKAALADWEYIPLNDREVFICFDSDVMLKPQVHSALGRLAGLLERRRAKVHFVYLPPGAAGAKRGLDDYLAEGHTAADLLALASDELRPIEGKGEDGNGLPYLEEDGCLWWRRHTRDGEVPTRLTNFSARIVGELVRDDGAETQRLFEIEAGLNGRTSRFSLSASKFMRMDWPAEHLGAAAVVSPGFGLRDHARAAIQELSGPDIPERQVFAHLGWREIGGVWHFLHSGGAVGPNGAAGSVEVDPPRELSAYRLPPPPEGEKLCAAVRASLRFLEVGPDRVSVPVFCMIWRAPLGHSDFSGYLVGRTGLYKTSVSALAQSHFGAQMDFGNLPADWKSTANYLEALAFAAKDVLLTVDDYVPGRGRADGDRLQRDADRLLRGQANRSGRGRLRADSTPRPPKPPRGLILSTGEDLPRGESLGARVCVVEFREGDVDVTALTACQADAAAGLYAAAMAGYVRWLATRYAQVSAGLSGEVRDLRAALRRPDMHPRTGDIVANLALGLRYFIVFAAELGAISEIEADSLWQRGWAVLGEAAAAQAAHIGTTEPAALFIRLLSAAITSGRAYIEAADGGRPASPQAWGWREERGEWRPRGDLVGWLDGEHLYLQPDASFAVAQAMGNVTGEEIAVSPYTLRKRLHERDLLASVDVKRKKLTVRHILGGTRRAVLHLRAESLTGDDGTDDDSELAGGSGNGPVPQPRWAGSPGDRPTSDCPTMSQDDLEGGSGTIGPVEPVSRAQEDQSDGGHTLPASGGTDEGEWEPRCIYRHPRLWRDHYGVLKCAVCHPPPFPEMVTAWVSRHGSGEAEQAEVGRG